MESCQCDSSSLHSLIQWDRWKQSGILLLPILQESEKQSNLVKAEWNAFKVLSSNLKNLKDLSFYVTWPPLSGKQGKGAKLFHFFLQMIQNVELTFIFLSLAESLRKLCTCVPQRNGRRGEESPKIQKQSAVKRYQSLSQPLIQWPSNPLPSIPSL